MKCRHCGKRFPSQYYFKTTHCCTECFDKLDAEAQERLLASDLPLSPHENAGKWLIGGKPLVCLAAPMRNSGDAKR